MSKMIVRTECGGWRAKQLLGRGSVAVLLALLMLGASNRAISAEKEHVQGQLISEIKAVPMGRTFTVGLYLRMDPHWHTYWRNPGDSGLPISLDWKLPEGFKAGSLQWPTPKRLAFSTLVDYVYEEEVLLLVDLTAPSQLSPGSMISLSAHAEWLVCIEQECIPGGSDLSLSLPVTAQHAPGDPHWSKLFADARRRLPADSKEWHIRAVRSANGYQLIAESTGNTATRSGNAYFFGADSGVVEPSAPQQLVIRGAGRSVALVRSVYSSEPAERLRGVWASDSPDGWAQGIAAIVVDVPLEAETPVAALTVSSEDGGAGPADPRGPWQFFGIALTAFVGGLILNLMPCVFPILAIKILGFARQAGNDRGRIARHGWVYTLGVVVSFWLLAGALLILRSGGNQLAWGYQLQSPLFVISLCFVLFCLALSLLGVYEMGVGVAAAANRVDPGKGLGGAFLNGALATLLATPCTAPFMGAAVAYALTRPAIPALGVFTSLAAGMAAPYLILSLQPAWLKFLPRPGAWMESLKQFMAFPLLGTVIWLLWVFGLQTGMGGLLQAMAALLLLGWVLWLWGRWGAIHRTTIVRRVAAAAVIAGGLAALHLAIIAAKGTPSESGTSASAQPAGMGWEPFSTKRLAQLRAEHQPVFVDFGAAWCATCIVNDRLVVNTAAVRQAFAAKKITLLKADWTRRDPEITQLLAAHGKSGVPFHVLYDDHGEEILTRDLVATNELLEAVRRLP